MTETAIEPSAAAHNESFLIRNSMTPDILKKYNGFILDQFGCMHNGVNGLEGAAECVQALKQQGKKIIILSNSSALSNSTMTKLPTLGFDSADFCGAVTSGQEASRHIAQELAGKRCLFMTWKTPKTPSPLDFIKACGNVTVADQVSLADFILLHGCQVVRSAGADGEATETSLGDYMDALDWSVLDPILNDALAANLPMICANPDYVYVRADGSVANMPGKIADRYQDMGGTVTSFGKPHQEHFEACVRELGLPKEQVIHIGDSLHHDIAGANASGIDSVFVAGGVHREELGCELNQVPETAALEALFQTHGQTPTYVVPMLRL